MLCCSVDELPDNVDSDGTPDSHDELIKTYECEIRKFHEVLVDEWLPEKVGLVLSKSGRALVNCPSTACRSTSPARLATTRHQTRVLFFRV